MTRIALALIVCAGLGFAAGKHQPNPPAVARSPAKPAEVLTTRSEGQPAKTPLVEKLIPKKPAGPADGDLSTGGKFRYESRRNAYIPVDFGNRRYTHGGQAVGAAHLVEHGHDPSAVAVWTQAEREIAHANDHASQASTRSANVSQKSVSQYTSSCPNGQCGNPSYSRGLFRRR